MKYRTESLEAQDIDLTWRVTERKNGMVVQYSNQREMKFCKA